MESIVITGACGLVATELTFRLLKNPGISLVLLSTHPERLRRRYVGRPNVACLTLEEFSRARHGAYKAIVHAAFARSGGPAQLLQSIDYERRLLEAARGLDCSAFVNISSQSVYGAANPVPWTEDTPLSPNAGDGYALAKAFSETLADAMLKESGMQLSSIRLSSVCENARFLRVFAENALAGKPINVQGGSQRFSFIDVRDVAEAIAALIGGIGSTSLRPVYNLGTGRQSSLLELAHAVKRVAEERYNVADVAIEMSPSDDRRSILMDSSAFKADFSWAPAFDDEAMIASLFEYLIWSKGGNEGMPDATTGGGTPCLYPSCTFTPELDQDENKAH